MVTAGFFIAAEEAVTPSGYYTFYCRLCGMVWVNHPPCYEAALDVNQS
jgi:hypothetical protein